MGRLLRRNIWIEAGISLFLMLFFIYFYCHIDQWVIETLPSTISPAFFPSVVTLVLIIMSALLTGFCLRSVRHMLAGKVDEERLELQEGGEEAGSLRRPRRLRRHPLPLPHRPPTSSDSSTQRRSSCFLCP